jgi:hypothetical protein
VTPATHTTHTSQALLHWRPPTLQGSVNVRDEISEKTLERLLSFLQVFNYPSP